MTTTIEDDSIFSKTITYGTLAVLGLGVAAGLGLLYKCCSGRSDKSGVKSDLDTEDGKDEETFVINAFLDPMSTVAKYLHVNAYAKYGTGLATSNQSHALTSSLRDAWKAGLRNGTTPDRESLETWLTEQSEAWKKSYPEKSYSRSFPARTTFRVDASHDTMRKYNRAKDESFKVRRAARDEKRSTLLRGL